MRRPFCLALGDQIADVMRDDTGFSKAAGVFVGEACEAAAEHSVAEPPDRDHLLGDDAGLGQAVQAGEREEGQDHRRDAGAIGLEHQPNEAELPQYAHSDRRQAHDDQPPQKRQEIARLGPRTEENRRGAIDRCCVHRGSL